MRQIVLSPSVAQITLLCRPPCTSFRFESLGIAKTWASTYTFLLGSWILSPRAVVLLRRAEGVLGVLFVVLCCLNRPGMHGVGVDGPLECKLIFSGSFSHPSDAMPPHPLNVLSGPATYCCSFGVHARVACAGAFALHVTQLPLEFSMCFEEFWLW